MSIDQSESTGRLRPTAAVRREVILTHFLLGIVLTNEVEPVSRFPFCTVQRGSGIGAPVRTQYGLPSAIVNCTPIVRGCERTTRTGAVGSYSFAIVLAEI